MTLCNNLSRKSGVGVFSRDYGTCLCHFFSSSTEQFAITEQKSVSSQVVGALALVYGQY